MVKVSDKEEEIKLKEKDTIKKDPPLKIDKEDKKSEKKEMLLLAPPKENTRALEKAVSKEPQKESIWTRDMSSKAFYLSQFTLLIVGLIFLSGFYLMMNDGRLPWGNAQTVDGYTPVTTEPISFSLDISNPDDDLLSFDKSIVVTGKTAPYATVIISGNNFDTGEPASLKGEFSQVITLSPGPNIIKITAFDDAGNSKTVAKDIYYSEDKLE